MRDDTYELFKELAEDVGADWEGTDEALRARIGKAAIGVGHAMSMLVHALGHAGAPPDEEFQRAQELLFCGQYELAVLAAEAERQIEASTDEPHYTAEEIAGLPGMPDTPEEVEALAERERWPGRWRAPEDGKR